jgi:transcriptional regulator with XRE-family HTH domain
LKKWYDKDMEHQKEINEKIAKNLIYYRKQAGLTQAELAEKINYSDKSVSKWESGNGVPDVYTLMALGELYNVPINAFVEEETPVQVQKKTAGLHLLITLLSCGIVWLVAMCAFVGLYLGKAKLPPWIVFLYASSASSIVVIVYASIWKHRIVGFIFVSALIWLTLTCMFITGMKVSIIYDNSYVGLWSIYLLGIPLQILEILWVFFRFLFRKNKKNKEMETLKNTGAELPQEIEEKA